MNLFYDERDDAVHEARGSQILYWLDDLDAKPLSEAHSSDSGFLFAGARSMADYRALISHFPGMIDRPEQRELLLRLDSILDALEVANTNLPQPKTWRLPLDTSLPAELTFPLFVRTAETSWKRGGQVGQVRNYTELHDEWALLRNCPLIRNSAG